MPTSLIKKEYFSNLNKIHRAFLSHHEGSCLATKYVSKEILVWFNAQSLKYTGYTADTTFKITTLWSIPKRAICKPYLMIYKNGLCKNTYGITLCYHNTQADTDMSDGTLFTIAYDVDSNNKPYQFSIIIER